MIRINLLPVRAAKKKESLRQQASVAGLSIVLLVLILGVFYFSLYSTVSSLKESISNSEKESARLDKEIGELKNIEAEKKVVLEKLNIVRQLEVNKRRHINVISDIARAVPERVWIDSLRETEQTVVVTGFAASDDILADFMRQLEKNLPSWRIELEIAQRTEKEKIKLAAFTMRLEKPKGPPPAAKPKA